MTLNDVSGTPRSALANPDRRSQQPWPKNERFRVLSIDGGGIKGLFPATVLAELERRYLGGGSIAGYFDLVAGTSTGGIIALGLGAGLTAAKMANLYLTRGPEVFPRPSDTAWGRALSWWRGTRNYVLYDYEREPLESLLTSALGDKLLGDSTVPLCIPAFEGKHSEVFVFKTPHHRD
jgi:patatin-like phospholipase/acyl hydrolase